MVQNIKESLEGAGLGLVLGLVIGVSEVDWLRVVLVLAIIGFATKTIMDKERSAGSSYRLALLGITSFFAILIGLYINGQQVFKQSPKNAIAYWEKAGFTPAQARQLWLKQLAMEPLPNNANTGTGRTIIQNFSSVLGTDSTATGNLASRLDSLQAIITQLSSGATPASALKTVKDAVSKNLFSSSETQKLCSQLDPDASPNAAQYFSVIENTGLDELKTLVLKDTEISEDHRYDLAKLLWDFICTVQSDKTTDWLKILNPDLQDAETMERIYNSQVNAAFGKIADWINKNAKNKEDYYIKMYALVKKL